MPHLQFMVIRATLSQFIVFLQKVIARANTLTSEN